MMSDGKRLCVLALSVFRSRLSDISIRDHVMLLWVILGGRVLRSHGGNAFFLPAQVGCMGNLHGLVPWLRVRDCEGGLATS